MTGDIIIVFFMWQRNYCTKKLVKSKTLYLQVLFIAISELTFFKFKNCIPCPLKVILTCLERKMHRTIQQKKCTLLRCEYCLISQSAENMIAITKFSCCTQRSIIFWSRIFLIVKSWSKSSWNNNFLKKAYLTKKN